MKFLARVHKIYRQSVGLMAFVALLSSAFILPQHVWAGPDVRNVVRGDVNIEQLQNQTNITASNNSIIDYNSFNVGAGEGVNFIQPGATARVLNRVLADNPSLIAGQINANGIVYLTNPAGIIFGQGATVNASQFFAAAGHLSDADFLGQLNHFKGLAGDVTNSGLIHAESIYLLGQNVRNFGTLQANGEVAMLAGDDVIIGHPLQNISYHVSADALKTHEVQQSGTITANNGDVFLGGGDMAAAAIHHDGITKARNIHVKGGEKGTAKISGTLRAEHIENNTGGKIQVTANTLEVREALLDASGKNGGGIIELGGGKKGQGELQNARRTLVDGQTKLLANATQSGDGGDVVVWAERQTAFWGHLEAKGAGLGNGGFAEVSGKYLTAKGHVDLTAPNGQTGTLLYDPIDIRIVGGSGDGADTNTSNNNVTGDGGVSGRVDFADIGTGATPFTIFESEIENTNANIILEAEENITVNGTFGGNELLITPNNDLILRIRNDLNGGSIDLTASATGDQLLVRTQGTGSIVLEGSTSGINSGNIRVPRLETAQGDISLSTNNGSIFLTNNLQTDGGDVTITGQTVLESNVTIDTELGNNSAAGNVDLQNAIISRVPIVESGEVGVITVPPNGAWQTITFSSSFSSPVVVGVANTNNGNAARVVEVQNVTSTSAQIRVCESDADVASGCATHPSEDVAFMVFDAADAGNIPGVEAGTFVTGNRFDGAGARNINFSTPFSNTPFVFTTVQSVTGTQFPVVTRVTATSTTGFTGGLCFQSSNDICNTSKNNETIGWIAIDPNEFITNLQNDSGSLGVANSQWENISFSSAFLSTPAVFAEIQTENGGQDIEIDEVRNVTLSGAEVRSCEIQGANGCDSHNGDTMAWYASEQGVLSASAGGVLTIDTTGATNGEVDLGHFDDAGGGFAQGVNVDAGFGGLVRLHNTILLDSTAASGAQFRVNNGADIAIMNDLTIATEQGGDNAAGALDFTGNTLYAGSSGVDLTLDTRGTTDGEVTLGAVSNSVGDFLQSLAIERGFATLTLKDDVTFNHGDGATGFNVAGNGNIIVDGDVNITMEAGQDGNAGVLDFSQATITTLQAFDNAEAGTFLAPANGVWQTLHFGASMTNPVVVATSNSANGGDGRIVSVRNITSNSAEIRLCQSAGPSGGCVAHPQEEVGYLVFDAADTASLPGIDAGTFSASGDFAGGGAETINFNESFSSAPLVFTSVQNEGGDFPVVARVRNTTNTNFTGGLCFQSADNSCSTAVGAHTVGWIAIDPNVMPFSTATDAGLVNVSNSAWTNVTFAQPFDDSPVVLVNNQTNNGGENGEIPEARNITTLNAQVRFCELDGVGSCDNHTGEAVAWFALEPFKAKGESTLTLDGRGTTGADIRLGAINGSGGEFIGNLTIENNNATTTLSGDIDLQNFNGPANVRFNGAGQVRLANDVTITTENGGSANAGRIDFGDNRVSGVTAGRSLTLNTSSASGDGGRVRLNRFDNNNGAEFFVQHLDVQTSGVTDGVLELFGNVRLNGSGGTPASFSFDGREVEVSGIAAISTEQTNNGDGGAIDLSNASIYGSAPARELTLDTATAFAGGTSGLISIGKVADNAGANSFLNKLTLNNSADTITAMPLTADIALDDNGFGGESRLSLDGAFTLPTNLRLTTEQGNNASAGTIDLTEANISASLPNVTLTLDASGQTDGDIALGAFSNSGGQFVNTLDARGANITQTAPLNLNTLRLLGGTATLNQANTLNTLAANLSGSLSFAHQGDFTVGTVLGTNGITTGLGASLTANGNDNLLTVQENITAGGDINLTADNMDIVAQVNAGANVVTILPGNNTATGNEIELGIVGDSTSSTLELSNTELGFITASAVNIGNGDVGNITLQSAINLLATPDILIRSGGNITLGGALTIGGDITLVAGLDFFNNTGANALQAGGNYLVYSTDPENNVRGGLNPIFEEFEKTFPDAPKASNLGKNGFIFTERQIVGTGLELTLPQVRTTSSRTKGTAEGDEINSSCTPGADFLNIDLCEGGTPEEELNEGISPDEVDDFRISAEPIFQGYQPVGLMPF